MSISLGVFIILICCINAINVLNMHHSTCQLMDVLKANDGRLPEASEELDKDLYSPIISGVSYEEALKGRYYTVSLKNDGTLANIVPNPYPSTISDKQHDRVVKAAYKAFSEGKKSGYEQNLRFDSLEETAMITYIFIDCSENFHRALTVFKITLLVGLFGLITVLFLVLFFSKIVLKPIEESYVKQKRFITDASHELKTPLTVISASVEVIEMEGYKSEWTEGIKEETKRLADLTQKLVFLARMEENGGFTKKMQFCISDAVEEECRVFVPVCQTKNKKLSLKIKPGVVYDGDEQLIRRMITLLVDNAVKYSDENSYIEISLEEINKKVVIKVSNPATGMPDGNMDMLFERFYRADPSHNSSTGGHGIGLSVVKAIAEAHKGKVSAKKENGVVTFTVTI